MVQIPDLKILTEKSVFILYVFKVCLKIECRKIFGSEKVDFSTVKSKQVRLPLAKEYAFFRVSLSKAEDSFIAASQTATNYR